MASSASTPQLSRSPLHAPRQVEEGSNPRLLARQAEVAPEQLRRREILLRETARITYAIESRGSTHLTSLLDAIDASACRKDTMVIVTYDEFGGQWDHVPPPGEGDTASVHDIWGPGTRLPALVISPFLRGTFVVDHRQHDTTSILRTIENRYRLGSLTSRDAAVSSLASVFAAHRSQGDEDAADDG